MAKRFPITRTAKGGSDQLPPFAVTPQAEAHGNETGIGKSGTGNVRPFREPGTAAPKPLPLQSPPVVFHRHAPCARRWKLVQRLVASDSRCDDIPASGLARIREGCLPEGAYLQPCLEAESGNLFAAFTPLPATGLRIKEPIAGLGAKKLRLDQRYFFVPPDPAPPSGFRGVSAREWSVAATHPDHSSERKLFPVREPRLPPGSLVCQRLHWEERSMKALHA